MDELCTGFAEKQNVNVTIDGNMPYVYSLLILEMVVCVFVFLELNSLESVRWLSILILQS